MTLAQARAKRDEAKRLLVQGIDPKAEQKEAQAKNSGAYSFETIASNQTDKVFKAYFNELSKLGKQDITLLMDYYHEQRILMEGIKATLDNMKNDKSLDLNIDRYSL